MAKVPVRVLRSFKGLPVGAETSMSLSRSRDAVSRGDVELVGKQRPAKKAAKKAPAKKAKAVTGTRNRSMAGRTRAK